MAAPVIESYTDVSHSGTAFDVTKPTGLAVGDLLLAIIAKDDDLSMSPPAGWTTDFDGSGVAALACASFIFHKVADAADVAASVFTFTGDSEDYVGRLYRISNVNGTPIDIVDATGNSGTSTAPQATAITTGSNDSLVFAFAGMDDNDTPYSLTTGGWTTDLNTDNTTAGIVIGRKVQATAGTTGAVDFTTNASDGWICSQIAIKSADAAGEITGTLDESLAVATASGAGTVLITGATSEALAALTADGVGSVDVSGGGSNGLGNLLLSSAAAVDVVGDGSATLDAATLDSAGVVGSAGVNGILDVTLAGLTSDGVGNVDVAGATAKELGAIAMDSAGTVDVTGSFGKSLSTISLTSTGTVEIKGELDQQLDNVPLESVGSLSIIGTCAIILGTLMLSARDFIPGRRIYKLLGSGFKKFLS